MSFKTTVEQWGTWEIALNGEEKGNPFVERHITATFLSKHETKTVSGFYNGDGVYIVRFMPSFIGQYTFTVGGNFSSKATTGCFEVTPAQNENHGAVGVHGFHFEYTDGTPYYPLGTTAYVWTMQSKALQQQTLDSLSQKHFNKIRFCVFPKHYLYNSHDPITFPYQGTPCVFNEKIVGDFAKHKGVQKGNAWNFEKFNPEHFQNLENAILELQKLGIEADIILMHAYDRWGFSQMSLEQDILYVKYVIARFSAYRNVWWSLANEYDLLVNKNVKHWEALADVLVNNDAYRHLRSIHNCGHMYDHTRPWITHCSIQRMDNYKCAELTDEFRTRYQKPVILDEIVYEGNIDQGWGNISGKELVRRFWEAAIRGGYASHGETFHCPTDILWWSHGGTLHGESPQRIAFLHKILTETPKGGLKRTITAWDEIAACPQIKGEKDYFIFYYGFNRPYLRRFYYAESKRFKAEIIDTWNMSITNVGEVCGEFVINLPAKPYMAIRLQEL